MTESEETLISEETLYEWALLEEDGLNIATISRILCDRYPDEAKAIKDWALTEAAMIYGHGIIPESSYWE